MTAKRLKRPRDPVELGKLIGDILTGQVEDHAAPSPSENGKDAAAVALGRKGGLKGGKARAAKMVPEQRTRQRSWGYLGYVKELNHSAIKPRLDKFRP
jgi:hypothetical protein